MYLQSVACILNIQICVQLHSNDLTLLGDFHSVQHLGPRWRGADVPHSHLHRHTAQRPGKCRYGFSTGAQVLQFTVYFLRVTAENDCDRTNLSKRHQILRFRAERVSTLGLRSKRITQQSRSLSLSSWKPNRRCAPTEPSSYTLAEGGSGRKGDTECLQTSSFL